MVTGLNRVGEVLKQRRHVTFGPAMMARDDELEVLKEQNGTERRWLPVGSNWQVRMASSRVRGPGHSKPNGGAIPYIYKGEKGYLFP